MTDAADIRRAIERSGLRGFARRCGCPVAAVQRLVKRGAYPERGPHGEAMRAAVAEALAEPAASLEAGASPAVPEIPERFAATLHALTVPAMAKDVPEDSAVLHALKALAADCGYTLEKMDWQPSYNPKLIALTLHPRSPVSGP